MPPGADAACLHPSTELARLKLAIINDYALLAFLAVMNRL
jgi:hypothetical protein